MLMGERGCLYLLMGTDGERNAQNGTSMCAEGIKSAFGRVGVFWRVKLLPKCVLAGNDICPA